MRRRLLTKGMGAVAQLYIQKGRRHDRQMSSSQRIFRDQQVWEGGKKQRSTDKAAYLSCADLPPP